VKAAGTPTAPIRSALARAAVDRYLEEDHSMMTTARLDTLVKDRDAHIALVKTILDAADELSRDLTADEAARVEDATAAAKALDSQICTARADLAVMEKTREIGAVIGEQLGDPGPGQAPPGGHLALTGPSAKTMDGRIIAAMPKDQSGQKALGAGQQTTSTIVLPEVVPTGRPAVSVLDVLPTRVVPPSYSFLRQSVRTLAAAPVAEAGTKPTSTVSVVAVENRLRVVAHISEPIPHYLLSDAVNLERFVEDELVFGLRRAVETEVLAGDGTGEHFTGILSTSGIVTQRLQPTR
jgi:HK97 family phage major capsid protein